MLMMNMSNHAQSKLVHHGLRSRPLAHASAAVLFVATLATVSLDATAARAKGLPWIVSAARAKRALAKGALLLDVRGAKAFARGHVAGSQRARWQRLSRRGRLASRARLQRELRALGVRANRAVLVAGDPARGWGEDGRVAWTLRSAGHRSVALVDGGIPALKRAGMKLVTVKPFIGCGKTMPTSFTVRINPRWRVDRAAVQKRLKRKRTRFVDAREAREFRGATPYGERRGGHLPGAAHLHYKALLQRDGRLLPRSRLLAKLKAAGVANRRQPIVAYCTGGVRSAWLVVVLAHLGYRDARNYAGSMWEWAAKPAASHPLIKP
jgi:thiosulfate/3-mercaptopyruvate sulfurtransferase